MPLRGIHHEHIHPRLREGIHSLPVLLADPTQVTLLFQNLVDNAVKFRGAAPPRVHVTAEPAEGEWRFAVQDNGSLDLLVEEPSEEHRAAAEAACESCPTEALTLVD